MNGKIHSYLAGPVTGCGDDQATLWREELHDQLSKVSGGKIRCVSPVRCELPNKGGFKVDEDSYFHSSRGISAKNWLDTERCDLVVALLPKNHFSLGTAIEIGWAIGLRKPIILITDDEWVSKNPLIAHNISYEVFSTEKLHLDEPLPERVLEDVTEIVVGLTGVYT